MHVCQSKVAARITISHPLMVVAHEMQDRGVKITNVDWIDVGTQADFVGGSVNDSRFHSATGEPGRLLST